MDAQALIKENNEKRKLLSKENLEWYEDMLVYIRLSFDKSEQETEEVLSEILDHLLEAQEDGKTIEEVFGDDPKAYADEITGELPKMITKKRFLFISMAILYFLASVALFSVIFKAISYYAFDLGELTETYYLGTQALKLGLSIPIAYIFMILIIHYLRWSTFKNINKVKEFFIFWLFGIFSVGIFVLVYYFIPDFGPAIELPIYLFIGVAVILYIFATIIKRKM